MQSGETCAIRVVHGRCANEIRETGIASLKECTARAGGVALEETPFSVLAYLEERPVGGLLGKMVWNGLYADLAWVQEDFRGRGIGTRVMKTAE